MYNEERPHQGKGNDLLVPPSRDPTLKAGKRRKQELPPDVVAVSHIACRERLGGLLKHYYRKAA